MRVHRNARRAQLFGIVVGGAEAPRLRAWPEINGGGRKFRARRRLPRDGSARDQPARRAIAAVLSAPGLSRNRHAAFSRGLRQQSAGPLHSDVTAAQVLTPIRTPQFTS